MTTTKREYRHRRGLTPAFLLGALAVAGACDHADEKKERPVGFSEQDAACSSIAPAAFVREGDRFVSRALASAERRARRGEAASPGRIGVDVKGDFAEGLRIVAPESPDADVVLTPLEGASRAPGRLRRDGAFVAYDGAYEGVGAALGASDRRVEERLRIEGPADLPRLRFGLRGGPAFGRW
ncbi:MAG TPA: hypothetical protein VFS00_13410 [Polyangiaceae bacterium]|nr:hypothetical protein [Polyangiaceae bacterium]